MDRRFTSILWSVSSESAAVAVPYSVWPSMALLASLVRCHWMPVSMLNDANLWRFRTYNGVVEYQ